MRTHYIALGLASGSLVAAMPFSPFGSHTSTTSSAPAGHDWQSAGPSDSKSSAGFCPSPGAVDLHTDSGRSPCPMLNSMSNHGWLPHDGKNIDLATIQTAFLTAMGFSTESFISITQQALALSTTGNSSTFNLHDLAHPNAIEHDGSLSRNDQFFGDDLHFNALIWATTALRYGIRNPLASPVITVETAAKARAARVRDAKVLNSDFSLPDQSGSIGETSVFLTAFWDKNAGGVPKDYARVLFGEYAPSTSNVHCSVVAYTDLWIEEERIPYAEGFVEGNHTLADVIAMASAVSAVDVKTLCSHITRKLEPIPTVQLIDLLCEEKCYFTSSPTVSFLALSACEHEFPSLWLINLSKILTPTGAAQKCFANSV